MSEVIIKNRVENLKNLLEIQGITARKLSLTAGLMADKVGFLLSGRLRFSDDLAQILEIALDVPPCILDQHPSLLIESKVAAEQERAHAINTFLGKKLYVDRYWNVRDLIEKSGMKAVEFANKTGIHKDHCSQLFSKKPVIRIHDSRARLIEEVFGLAPNVLDQKHERNTLAAAPRITQVSPEAIDLLGTGAYLNRFLNINNVVLSEQLTHRQIGTIVGFKTKASEKLVDPPQTVIDSASARAFERHFNLEPGAVDQCVPGFDYAGHQSSYVIGEQVFNKLKTGVPLHRYVNTRRILQERGISLMEFVSMMERTRALVYSVLSDSIATTIGDQSARRMEKVLGLTRLGLDFPREFRVAKARPGSKLDRALSRETELQP
jgi:plasmid maintenance system antidote protein VapI